MLRVRCGPEEDGDAFDLSRCDGSAGGAVAHGGGGGRDGAVAALPGDLAGRQPRSSSATAATCGRCRRRAVRRSRSPSTRRTTTAPVWSPDGSRIAFASDRYGNFDVFVMPAAGGEATRLTFHSADGRADELHARRHAPCCSAPRASTCAANVQFPTGAQPELYRVATRRRHAGAGAVDTGRVRGPRPRRHASGLLRPARATRWSGASTTTRRSRATSGSGTWRRTPTRA